MTYVYIPRGVCSRKIEIDMTDGIIEEARVTGGCNGNLKGICRLVRGARAADVIEQLHGIRCEHKPTSCPDQLSRALIQALQQQQLAN